MKIAAVTEDDETISPQINGATKYLIFTVEGGQIITEEKREVTYRPEVKHDRLDGLIKHQDNSMGAEPSLLSIKNHLHVLKPIFDCNFVLSRGMDQRTYIRLQCLGIQAIITDIRDIKKAVQAVIDGSIENHLKRLYYGIES